MAHNDQADQRNGIPCIINLSQFSNKLSTGHNVHPAKGPKPGRPPRSEAIKGEKSKANAAKLESLADCVGKLPGNRRHAHIKKFP